MDRGFSLIEALVATSLMAVAGIGLAHLSVVSIRANQIARSSTIATLLASQKIEGLRGLAWTEITPSPPGALFENTTGFFDTPAPDFVRRWSIEPLPPNDTVLIQVSVIRASSQHVRDASRRRPGESRIVDVRTRKAP